MLGSNPWCVDNHYLSRASISVRHNVISLTSYLRYHRLVPLQRIVQNETIYGNNSQIIPKIPSLYVHVAFQRQKKDTWEVKREMREMRVSSRNDHHLVCVRSMKIKQYQPQPQPQSRSPVQWSSTQQPTTVIIIQICIFPALSPHLEPQRTARTKTKWTRDTADEKVSQPSK